MSKADMLGKKVKHVITGLVGIATARIEYLNGCVQYQIQPKIVKDGVPATAQWYDQEQVELVHKKKPAKKKMPTTGGPATNRPAKSLGQI